MPFYTTINGHREHSFKKLPAAIRGAKHRVKRFVYYKPRYHRVGVEDEAGEIQGYAELCGGEVIWRSSMSKANKYCCEDFKYACSNGADRDYDGPAVRSVEEYFFVGSSCTPLLRFCPWCGCCIRGKPMDDRKEIEAMTEKDIPERCPFNAEVRLAEIAKVIEGVDNRCMTADGYVAKTLEEMTQAEISSIYALAINDRRYEKAEKAAGNGPHTRPTDAEIWSDIISVALHPENLEAMPEDEKRFLIHSIRYNGPRHGRRG